MAESISNEMLNYAISQGIIDLSHIQDAVNMNKRKEILEQHPYSIWESKDGKWHTYLPDEEKGRVPRKRNTKKDIENLIVDYYKEQVENTFEYWWQRWKNKQEMFGVANNTLLKYDSDYKRFFKGQEIECVDIRQITDEDITIFMVDRVKEFQLKEKGAKALFGYVKGIFKHARTKRQIVENPCEYVEQQAFLRFCKVDFDLDLIEERVLSNEDVQALLDQIQQDKHEKPEYIPLYAVELAFYTGMRIGELTGLKWSDVREKLGYLVIQYSERYDRVTKTYSVGKTKTGKSRLFPLSKDVKRILTEVKKQEMKNGYFGEYVFSGENGKIHAYAISDCLTYRCKKLGIRNWSIHAIRRTVNSHLRASGVPDVIASALLGHTKQVNARNYTYDVSSMDLKNDIVSKLYEAV